MEVNKEEKSIDMLDKIYCARQEDFEKEASVDRKKLLDKLNNITQEELEKIIEEKWQDDEIRKKFLKDLDGLVENYEIKMAYYMEKMYKQGFKDAINLWKMC